MVDWSDRTTCVLFGDGAGAVVLKADEDRHPQHPPARRWREEGTAVEPGRRVAGFKPDEDNAGVRVLMTGNEVFKHAVKALDGVVDETLEANGLDKARRRLADPAPGQPAHHRGHGQSAWTCRWIG